MFHLQRWNQKRHDMPALQGFLRLGSRARDNFEGLQIILKNSLKAKTGQYFLRCNSRNF